MDVGGFRSPQNKGQVMTLAVLLILGIGIGILCVVIAYRNPVLSAALVAVIVSSILGIWHPRLSFFLFLALLPFVDFLKRVQLAFTNPSSLEWYLVLALPDFLLLSATVGVVLRQVITKGRLSVRLGRTDWWLLAFVAATLLSVIHSVFPVTIGMAVFKLGGMYILIYFVAPTLINKHIYLRLLLKITFVLAIIVALYGLSQTAFGMTSFERDWLAGGYTGMSVESIIYHTFRPFSTLSSPQAYAHYLAIGLLSGLLYIHGYVPASTRKLWYIGVLALVVALGLSLVRTAFLFFAVAWLFGRWFHKGRLRRPPIVVSFLGLASVVGFVLLVLRFGQPIQSWAISSGIPIVQRALVVGTLNDRLLGWQRALSDFRYWTFLGHGLGTTASTVMKKYSLTFNLFSHDEYTGLLVEQGVLGLILFLGFVSAWMRSATLRLQALKGCRLEEIGWAFMGVSVAILLVGLLGTVLKVSPINVYLWLLMGLLARSSIFSSSPMCAYG